MVRRAIEGQIGMLTCQVLEMGIQLQQAYNEISRLNAELVEANTFRAEVDALEDGQGAKDRTEYPDT